MIVNIKTSAGSRWDEQVDGSFAILDLKALLSESCDIATEHQRLVYKGRVLQDALTLDSSGVVDGGQIYLVRGSGSPSAAQIPPATETPVPDLGPSAAATPFGMQQQMMSGGSMHQMQQQMMQNPEMVRQMMNSPMVDAMMNDPDLLQNMVSSNPQLQQLMESNPEVGHLLSDPAVLRQSLETARNPQLMREMMRNTDRAMSNIEAHPEGFNTLRRLYTNVQQPLLQLGQPGASTDDDPDAVPAASPTTPNTAALPNPWAPAPPSAASPSARLFGPPRPGASLPVRNPFAHMFGGGGVALGVPPLNQPPAVASLGESSAPAGGASAASVAVAVDGTPTAVNPFLALVQLQLQAQQGQSAAAGPQLLQQVAPGNSAVQQMLRDPAFLQQVQRRMADPGVMQAALQARMGGAVGAAVGEGGAAPPPLWDSGSIVQLLNQNGALPGPAGSGVVVPPPANSGQLYASQLQTLTDMGFVETDANLRALVSTGGNVQAAVERLLS